MSVFHTKSVWQDIDLNLWPLNWLKYMQT